MSPCHIPVCAWRATAIRLVGWPKRVISLSAEGPVFRVKQVDFLVCGNAWCICYLPPCQIVVVHTSCTLLKPAHHDALL